MKFQAVVDEFSAPMTIAMARCVVVPDSAFDGVFGNGISLQFPYMEALDRTAVTNVVNRYVVYVVVVLKKVSVKTVLLGALAVDFKKKFPNLGDQYALSVSYGDG